MLILLSPAKKLDYESSLTTEKFSQPTFTTEAQRLINHLKKSSLKKIKELMDLSDQLTELNKARYENWTLPFTPENARPAMFAFKGDVYQGLKAETFSEESIDFAQDHLRILSGLHGLLQPLDLIQPYRLEMGTKLAIGKAKNLYEFWGTKIADQINQTLEGQEEKVLVNLASNEYFKAAKAKQINAKIITPVFKDFKTDRYKVIFLYAKQARGYMANYIIENQLTSPEGIKGFDREGYLYNEQMSTETEWVFTRG